MKRTTPHFSLRLLPLLMALGGGFTASAQAQSLVDLYNAARDYDAPFQSARSQYDATLARADQAQALLLPTVGLQSSLTRTTQEPQPLSERAFNTQTNTLAASQPLYRPANLVSYKQGKKQTELAKSQMEAAEQDLIVRVSQGDLPHGSIGYQSIFAAGMVLFVMTMAFNILGWILRKRFREAY